LLKEDYDLVIDLQAKFSSWWLRRFIKTRSRAVYKKKHIARWLYVKTHKGKGIESTLKLYYSVFPKLGLPVGQNAANLRKPHLKPLDTGIEKILFSNLRECKMKIIALFPGAAHQTKMYPPSSWMEVIGKSDADWYYLLLGSAQESFIASVIKNQYPLKCENLCGKYSPEQLISVIDGCDLVLSNDSGPMHIAAALSKPQIAIFGATHPKLGFSPLNDNAVVLSADLDCQPCSLHGSERCPQKHFACMRDISADHILMKMREIL
ncbi:MAG: glycosyltransferase family 9 protein, partial [Candidatus Cloacimonetes bacterium]|nr:glycosyltransferase family 9 protein [Candidatus Cloacimonadota bacterium]